MAKRRVLIKDRNCDLYYVGLDQWTGTEKKALTFRTIREAAQHITRTDLKNVEIVSEP